MNISDTDIDDFRKRFETNKKYKLLQNIVSNNSINSISKKNENLNNLSFEFNHEIKTKVTATHQMNSGTCWIFACLNLIRTVVIEKYGLSPDFQLSQGYVYIWSKFEKFNAFLETIYNFKKTRNKKFYKSLEYKTLLLSLCSDDGGNWGIFKTIIKKYGILPDSEYPRSLQLENTNDLNNIIESLAIKCSHEIFKSTMDRDDFEVYKKRSLEKCYRIINLCAGLPPVKFNFTLNKKNKSYTPKSFYDKIVLPLVDVDNFISISNIERIPYNKKHCSEYGGVVFDETTQIKRNICDESLNVDMYNFKDAITKCIDVHAFPVVIMINFKSYIIEHNSILDQKSSLLSDIFDIQFDLSKLDSIKSFSNIANHMMAIHGYNLEKDNTISKWKVENSHGAIGKYGGICLMTDEWFQKYTLSAIVPLDCLEPSLRKKAKDVENIKWFSFWL